MITLVKFFADKRNEGVKNQIITKTLGKTGVIHWPLAQQKRLLPKEEEFWFVQILRETCAGTSRGLFVLEPLERVRTSPRFVGDPDIIHMIPGTWDGEEVDNSLLLHPHVSWFPDRLGPNWILGFADRKLLKKKYRKDDQYWIHNFIVVFDRTHDWPKEAPKPEVVVSTDSLSESDTSEKAVDSAVTPG